MQKNGLKLILEFYFINIKTLTQHKKRKGCVYIFVLHSYYFSDAIHTIQKISLGETRLIKQDCSKTDMNIYLFRVFLDALDKLFRRSQR